jgi:glycosyltransferase involved in cell wall biosynthesis
MTAQPLDYTVIIPCYNGSATLDRAIASALRQRPAPAEIIVVDDGSADVASTELVVARYPGLVRLIRQKNQGPAAARNTAARAATSSWLAFLDSDDSWIDSKMGRQLDLVIDDTVGLIHDSDVGSGEMPASSPSFDDLWEHNWVRTSAAVVRRQAFEAVHGFDEDRELVGAEDYNLWLRLSAAGWKVMASRDTLINYTPAMGSITSQVERCARGELLNIRKIKDDLGLDPQRVEKKILAIRTEFGRHLLHCRSLRAAREMLAAPMRQPTLEVVMLWLATFIPVRVLDLRRSMRARLKSVPG